MVGIKCFLFTPGVPSLFLSFDLQRHYLLSLAILCSILFVHFEMWISHLRRFLPDLGQHLLDELLEMILRVETDSLAGGEVFDAT